VGWRPVVGCLLAVTRVNRKESQAQGPGLLRPPLPFEPVTQTGSPCTDSTRCHARVRASPLLERTVRSSSLGAAFAARKRPNLCLTDGPRRICGRSWPPLDWVVYPWSDWAVTTEISCRPPDGFALPAQPSGKNVRGVATAFMRRWYQLETFEVSAGAAGIVRMDRRCVVTRSCRLVRERGKARLVAAFAMRALRRHCIEAAPIGGWE